MEDETNQKNANISNYLPKIEMVRKLVKPILIFGHLTWPTSERQRNRLNAIEMGFLRKIENKTRMNSIRNQGCREA